MHENAVSFIMIDSGKKGKGEKSMRVFRASLDWLENPEVYAVNRMKAHSDHSFYEDLEEAGNGQMSLRQSLNGIWHFAYSENPKDRPEEFYREDFGIIGFSKIEVPGHIELQGYGQCQYTNVRYPWDGKESLQAPAIPKEHNPVGSYMRYFQLIVNWKGKRCFFHFKEQQQRFMYGSMESLSDTAKMDLHHQNLMLLLFEIRPE